MRSRCILQHIWSMRKKYQYDVFLHIMIVKKSYVAFPGFMKISLVSVYTGGLPVPASFPHLIGAL